MSINQIWAPSFVFLEKENKESGHHFDVLKDDWKRLEKENKELEYQLHLQKDLNPISVNMVASISELSEKLRIAVECINFCGTRASGNIQDIVSRCEDTIEKIRGDGK